MWIHREKEPQLALISKEAFHRCKRIILPANKQDVHLDSSARRPPSARFPPAPVPLLWMLWKRGSVRVSSGAVPVTSGGSCIVVEAAASTGSSTCQRGFNSSGVPESGQVRGEGGGR